MAISGRADSGFKERESAHHLIGVLKPTRKAGKQSFGYGYKKR